MNKRLIATACLLLGGLLQPALAQTSTAAPRGDSLYTSLGEQAGIARLMDDFVNRVLKDERIGQHFKDAKPDNLKTRLTEQVCKLSGGPCEYKGADMKTVHADMDIRRADFNALVEVLQAAMEAQNISFPQQRRLLALLAPMHRDTITVH